MIEIGSRVKYQGLTWKVTERKESVFGTLMYKLLNAYGETKIVFEHMIETGNWPKFSTDVHAGNHQFAVQGERNRTMIDLTMNLKLTLAGHLKDEEKDLVQVVDDGAQHTVVITTNKLIPEVDRRDARYVNALKNLKIVYRIAGGGILILKGNLSCSFRNPFGGEFYVTGANLYEKQDFTTVRGVMCGICFTSPMSIDQTRYAIERLKNNPELVFNISQFDEFMEIFEFYKALSSELNNNTTYRITRISQPYYFVPVYEKEVETEEQNQVLNAEGIVVGHTIEDYQYEMLSSEQKDCVRTLRDIVVNGDTAVLKKIRKFSENLYVSNKSEVDEANVRFLKGLELILSVCKDESVILSVEDSPEMEYGYLHLYDMGQKVKLESIENSLRLIHQGNTGAAAEMLEYIIGDKPMPSNGSQKSAIKEQYASQLDPSQKKAFYMATDGSPVSLIKGPPGTGKTYVINAIVQYITKHLKEKVVISSQTHVAIDNVLDELMENYDLIIPNRITNRRNKYAGSEIDDTLYRTWGRNFDEHNARSSQKTLSEQIWEDMQRFTGEKRFCFSEKNEPSSFSVIGATTTTSAIGGKKGLELLKGYDWLIIDEVSKCPITEVLRYLPYVKHIIMVGDDFQLAPLLEFTKEDVEKLSAYDEDKFERLKRIYEESVFAKTLQKAKDAGRLVTLTVNYRSLENVLRAYNVFYNGELENKRERVRSKKVFFDAGCPLSDKYDSFFIDVQYGKEARDNTSRYNVQELEATAVILRDLIEHTLDRETISVAAIFPYAAQISRFQKGYRDLINEAKRVFKSFEIDTVDAFQGKEADIVLVNTVVTDPSQRNFLNDFRRINVSVSRSRDKLFIFGNPTTLSQIDMQVAGGDKRRYFAEIINDIRKFGGMIKYEGGESYEFASKPKISII